MLRMHLSRLLFLSFLSVSTDIDYTSTLQEAEVPIIDLQTCESMYNPVSSALSKLEPMVKKDMICAGDIHKKKGACKVRFAGEIF